MRALFHIDQELARGGLALVALGMGFHLMAGTLNQAALAREQAGAAAAAWLLSAVLFVAFMLSPLVDDQLLRAEAGYCGATALLCALRPRLAESRPGPAQPVDGPLGGIGETNRPRKPCTWAISAGLDEHESAAYPNRAEPLHE